MDAVRYELPKTAAPWFHHDFAMQLSEDEAVVVERGTSQALLTMILDSGDRASGLLAACARTLSTKDLAEVFAGGIERMHGRTELLWELVEDAAMLGRSDAVLALLAVAPRSLSSQIYELSVLEAVIHGHADAALGTLIRDAAPSMVAETIAHAVVQSGNMDALKIALAVLPAAAGGDDPLVLEILVAALTDDAPSSSNSTRAVRMISACGRPITPTLIMQAAIRTDRVRTPTAMIASVLEAAGLNDESLAALTAQARHFNLQRTAEACDVVRERRATRNAVAYRQMAILH